MGLTQVVVTSTGTALMIDGIVVDPAGASLGNALVFDGTKFVPGAGGGGGSTGNWVFSGNSADLNAAGSQYIGSSVGTTGNATAVVIGQQNGATVWLGSNAGSGTTNVRSFINWFMDATAASAGTQLVNSPAFNLRPHYWNGTVDTTYAFQMLGVMDSTGPTAHLSMKWNGTEMFQFTSAKAFNLAVNATVGAIAQAATNTTALTINPNVADGASSIGLVIKNSTALVTGGAKLFSVFNATTEGMYLDAVNYLLRFPVAGGGISDGAAGTQLAFSASGVYFFGNTFYPFTTDSSPLGAASNRWLSVFSDWYDTKLGAQLTAAATITPTCGLHHVTGATTINTIATTNLPVSGNVRLTIIADGGTITFGNTGNVAVGATIAVNSHRVFVWDNSAAKWYPHN